MFTNTTLTTIHKEAIVPVQAPGIMFQPKELNVFNKVSINIK